jgi:lipoprotein-anchoring transpeptidase ErfK/SrfK
VQTIKTAAIVVLMLTVLYGGYVSLTTPPEPLPEEIEEYLVIEESAEGPMMAETDLPDGLQLSEPPTDVGTDDASAAAAAPTQTGKDAAAINPPPAPSPEASIATAPPEPETAPTPSETMPDDPPTDVTFGGSFVDLPPRKPRPEEVDSPKKSFELPKSSTAPAATAADSLGQVMSTEQEFELPDPTESLGNFDPSRGKPFVAEDSPTDSKPVGFRMDDSGETPAASDGNVAAQADVDNSTERDSGSNNLGLINAFKTADAMYSKGQLKEALATLSVFYGMPDLDETQNAQLLSRLDPLAREVIYSKRHLLEQPYRVSGNETLTEIAKKFDVPWQLLANINQIEDPVTVLPGTELKTVRGPFRAEVDLTRKQLTIFLGDLYAGRFEIGVGNDPPPAPGTFTVQDKQTARTYYNRAGAPVPPGSPSNPYGGAWMDLGGQICIHGSPNTVQPTDKGCISLADDFADDLYGILSQGSAVTIRR